MVSMPLKVYQSDISISQLVFAVVLETCFVGSQPKKSHVALVVAPSSSAFDKNPVEELAAQRCNWDAKPPDFSKKTWRIIPGLVGRR